MQGKVQTEKIDKGNKFRHRDDEYMYRKKKLGKPARKNEKRQYNF